MYPKLVEISQMLTYAFANSSFVSENSKTLGNRLTRLLIKKIKYGKLPQIIANLISVGNTSI